MIDTYVYDFEVFPFDWVVTFKNHQTGEELTFHNDYVGLQNWFNENIKFKAVLVGYNNRFYDDYILHAILNNVDPYRLNDWMIVQGKDPWTYPELQFKKKQIISYDCMSCVAVGQPTSLKQIEGYLGWKIFESQIPFDIDRALTKEELAEVIEYNKYDVWATDKLFTKIYDNFIAHISLNEMYELDPLKLGTSAANKTAMILGAKKLPKYDTYKYEIPEKIRHLFDPEDEIVKAFTTTEFYCDRTEITKQNFKLSKQMRDFTFEFGLGGGHGAIPCVQIEGEIWNLDVKSYYVSLMVQYNLFSRSVEDGPQKFGQIRDIRVKHKDEGNVGMADGLKLILVAAYGCHGFEKNLLYDKQQQTAVCITGQLLLYLLTQKLEPYARIIQVNTDGIMIEPIDKEKCIEVYKWWEEVSGMELELSKGVKVCQRDVNNYVLLKQYDVDLTDKRDCEKKIKAKGNGVKYWNTQMQDDSATAISFFTVNNNHTIVDEAVVKKLLFGIPMDETIRNCKDLIRFQRIIKLMTGFTNITVNVGDSYELLKLKHLYGKMGDEVYHGKVYRVFFCRNGYRLKKYKEIKKINENGEEEITVKNDSIANCSDNCKILIEDLNSYNINDLDLDYDYYIDLAENLYNSYFNKE